MSSIEPRLSDKDGYLGRNLVRLIDVWATVEKKLGLTKKQAAEYVEAQIREFSIKLFSQDHDGLFRSMKVAACEQTLLDMWQSAENHGWKQSEIEAQGWTQIRIDWDDTDRLLDHVEELTVATPGGSTARISHEQRLQHNQWPWGKHDTQLLQHLAAAAEKWWKNFDPADNTTAPTNQTVSEWLQQRGVGQSMADKMATILRADGLPTGPRT